MAVFWLGCGLISSVSSGKSQQIVIENNKGRLSQEEIERMVKEAEEFAEQDEAQRKRIETLNSLSTYVFSLKTQLGDQEGLGGKVHSFHSPFAIYSLIASTAR